MSFCPLNTSLANLVFVIVVALCAVPDVVHAQAAEYELIRTDDAPVTVSGSVTAGALDWDVMSGMGGVSDGDNLGATAQASANDAGVANASHGVNEAHSTGVATAYVNTAWDGSQYGPNSSACISYSGMVQNEGPLFSISSAGINANATADALFELQPLTPSDPSKRPVLWGALHVIITEPVSPFNDYGSSFNVKAGSSSLSGSWAGPSTGWVISKNLHQLDNGVSTATEYWPSTVNRVALVAEEATVGEEYPVTSILNLKTSGSADYTNSPGTFTNINFGSLASWYFVSEEDDTESNFTASTVSGFAAPAEGWPWDIASPPGPDEYDGAFDGIDPNPADPELDE